MSTPHSESGVVAADGGDARWFLGNLARIKLTGEQTGGRFSLVELTAPRGDMPPLHVHHVDDETFMVLEGELSLFLAGGAVHRACAGSMVLAPRGVPHVYRVESESARWRVISSPASFDEFVAESSTPATDLAVPDAPPLAPEQLVELGQRHGIEILGPPGTYPS